MRQLEGDNVTIIRQRAPRNGTLQEIAAKLSGLNLADIGELIDLGAVYYSAPSKLNEAPRWIRAKRLGDAALLHPIQQV